MRRLPVTTKAYWFQRASKGLTLAFSAGAALVSFVSALYSYGFFGNPESHQSIGNFGAAWVRIDPTTDTAHALGDTVRFAATIADKNGSVLVGARPTWTTGDSSIARVEADGAVIAQRPGSTTVSAIVGSLVATSRVIVKQTVAGVVISSSAGDAAVTLREGSVLQLRARALDARGHTVVQAGAVWHIDDTAVAVLDSSGLLSGLSAGRSVVSARIDDRSGYLPVSVVTTATELALVAGSGQRAPAGRMLPQPIVVRATNRRGEPTPGKTVTFRFADGGGKADPPTAITDADGRARTTWTLASHPGRQTLFATVESLDTAAAVIAESDPLPENTRIVALRDSLSAEAGALLSDSVEVRLTDTTGRVLADVPVHWTALDGGVAEAIDARSDSLGIARARWTLGKHTGTQRLRVQVGSGVTGRGVAPITIPATALAGTAADLVVVSGDRQTAAAGAALRKPLIVRVVDANGNGVASVPLVLSLSAGTVPDSAPRTNADGVASIRWTMGRSASAHALAIHIDGIKKLLKLTATARPAAPANLSFDDAPAQKRAPATRVKRLYALVTDIYGNPVPDARVTFTAKTGTVTPARAVTDAKGRVLVRWTPGATAGEHTLRGAVRSTDVKGSYVTQTATKRSGTK